MGTKQGSLTRGNQWKQWNAIFPWLLIAPSLLFIALLNLYPLAEGIYVSFQQQELTRPELNQFAGFDNYARALFEEKVYWGSLGRTIVWTIGSVSGSYVLGLGLAVLLNQDIWGRAILRALILIPWVVPNIVASLLWKWMYNDEFGIFNYMLLEVGIIDTPIRWLSNMSLAMPSLIVVQVWKTYPLMTVILLAALQGISVELYEAATIDGSSAWQRFLYVTLPLIRPTSILVTLLMGIWTFQTFDLVYLLTGGGPANATMVLPTLIYNKAFFALNMGYAAALGVLSLIILLVVGLIYIRLYSASDS